MATLHLRDVELGNRPRVAMVLGAQEQPGDVRPAMDAGVDLLELRVDQFEDRAADAVIERIKAFNAWPVLATIRSEQEGGQWDESEENRVALFKALIPEVDAVDIELSASDIFSEVVHAARDHGKLVIGSYHNFKETPSSDALKTLAGEARVGGAHIVKVAAHCENIADVRTLAAFTLDCRHVRPIVIGMGQPGSLTRVFFPALGSLVTYCALGDAKAPGQLGYADTLKYIAAFYPASDSEDDGSNGE